MRRHVAAVCAAALLLTGCRATIVQNEPDAADHTVYTRESAGIRLQDDFYGYVNFDFLYGSEIPADLNELSAGQLVNRRTDRILSDEILTVVQGSGYPAGSDEQKIHDLYAQFLDTETRSAVGFSPLEKGFAAIEQAQTADEFVRACGMLYTDYGTAVLPAVRVTQNHFDSSRYIVSIGQTELFYSAGELLHDKDSAENLQRQLAGLLAASETDAADALAYDAVTMLLEIAKNTADLSSMTIEEMYHSVRPDALDLLIAAYLDTIGLGGREVIVYDTGQLDTVCALLTEERLPLWKAIAKCILIYRYRDVLPPELTAAFGAENSSGGEKALNAVKTLLSGETGNLYAKNRLDEKTLKRSLPPGR